MDRDPLITGDWMIISSQHKTITSIHKNTASHVKTENNMISEMNILPILTDITYYRGPFNVREA